ncbi:MAG: DUF4282 domain-containing protein [Acidobacteria bacterium]|nr:DUF4282 domain-containing protein [Acidobacteriota bacterium]
MQAQEDARGLLGALFDFSFTSFITTKLVPVLYGIGIAISGLIALFFVVAGLRQGAAAGVAALILGALLFLLSVMYARVVLEVLIVIFRIAEHTAEIASRKQGQP